MSRPFNCTGVVGVKFRDFNPTMKLTKFKHPRNLPTVRTVYILYVNIAVQCTLIYMYMCIYVCDYGYGAYTVQVGTLYIMCDISCTCIYIYIVFVCFCERYTQ